MELHPTLKISSKIALSLGCLIFFLFHSGCDKTTNTINEKVLDTVLTYDYTIPLTKEQDQKIDQVRSFIKDDDIGRLIKFYALKYYFSSVSNTNYADSALTLFINGKASKNAKADYLAAMLMKAEEQYGKKYYNKAVLLYFEAKSFREKYLDDCFGGPINARIGDIYFAQGNFLKAANYYKESYNVQIKCYENSPDSNRFYNIQGLLNNAGYSYEQAEMLDSALYFYQKDVAYIESAQTAGNIHKDILNDAKTVVFDNMGGVYLKLNQLDQAETYLLKTISMVYKGGDGMYTTPLIKLAKLYTLKGNFGKAELYFSKSRLLLDRFPSTDFEARWHKAKAGFYALQNKHELAYQYQQKFIDLTNQLKKEKENISLINIEKDFANLERKYALQDLEKEKSIKNVYLIFALFLLVFVIIVAFLLQKNVKQARKSSQIVSLHNDELKLSLQKLEEVNQSYARIMKVMAHDLRNPLAGISGISSLLLEEEHIAESITDITVIKESADHALKMINEILNSVLFAERDTEMKREKVDVQLILSQCVSMLAFKASEKNQELVLDAGEEVFILANKEKLWRLFNNLIVNAIKFSGQHTIINIALTVKQQHIVVSVADRGIGIPDEIAEKIFDVFTDAKRLGTAGEQAYGLGLSISKQIAAAHFGKIWFEKNPQGGTIFYVQLPK